MVKKNLKYLLLGSGGLDSTTLLHEKAIDITHVLHFNYGQSNYKSEQKALDYFTDKLGKFLITQDLKFNNVKSALLGHAGYSYGLLARNYFFVLNAVHTAVEYGLDRIYMGLYENSDYSDCSDVAFRMMRSLVIHGSEGKVDLELPYAKIDKYKIYQKALELGVDVDKTHSCYHEVTCGRCPACMTLNEVKTTVEKLREK
jgi:7-cyano-7-deazaguanine synthase